MRGPLRLRHRVLEAVRRHRMWTPGQSVVVACSGGRDSVVLLDVLVATRGAHQGLLSVVTIDHGQREDSADDAVFVADWATRLGLPVEVVAVTPRSGSEAELRAARHEVFDAHVARGRVVAIGHHRRDQAETVLLQLLRGGGVAARRGMLAVRDGRVRPLLDEPPGALADWAAARQLSWREDASNRSLVPLRNRVRQRLLPLLEVLRPGAEAALARSARLAALDEAVLDGLARDLPLVPSALADAPEALARRALQGRWPSLRAAQVDAALDAMRAGKGCVALGDGRELVVADGVVDERAVGAASGVVTTVEPASAGLEESP